jgi:hypothetical protein
MYRQIIEDANRTNKESDIYEAIRRYTHRHMRELPSVYKVGGPEEPYMYVPDFMRDVKQGKVRVWARHFETEHEYLTPTEYGMWRAVHDVFGHGVTFDRTAGRMGNFNFRGEIESLFAVGMDTKNLLIVEGAVLETVQRNLTDATEFSPFSNEATLNFATQIIQIVR